MSKKSALGYLLVALLVLGLAQYMVLMTQLQAAQRSFRQMTSVYQTAGDRAFRKSVVEALEGEGFEVEPRDISIETGGPSATARFRLVVTRERKVLWFPVRKTKVLKAEVPYDLAL